MIQSLTSDSDLGILLPAWPGDAEHRVVLARRVVCFAVRDSHVATVYDIVNPAKLIAVPQ